jgi:hypothetical protein
MKCLIYVNTKFKNYLLGYKVTVLFKTVWSQLPGLNQYLCHMNEDDHVKWQML